MGIVRNLSVRVPWHDQVWNGNVCRDPLGNSSCLAVKMVAEGRVDAFEAKAAGESFNTLSPSDVPPCLRSSASFLSPEAHSFESVMSYSTWSQHHKHILPRSVHVPAWGALTIPYRWMLKESGFEIAEELGLDCGETHEPGQPDWLARTSWIQGRDNQVAMLEAFANPLVENESLVLFYATRTPLSDSDRRVLLGAALLSKKHQLQEYAYSQSTPGLLRTMVWERPIQHSLRQARDGQFTGGVVMPYHALLRHCADHPDLDPADFIAFAPDDARIQFSYGSEHVTHGAAAAALMSARHALERTATVLAGPWEAYIEWIDGRLSDLWKMQGPAPGLGSVLSAMHKGFNGTLFAMALADELPVNADPWPVIDEILSGSREAPAGSPLITSMLKKRWKLEQAEPDRLDLLKLLARFELTKDQAKRAMGHEPSDILSNPYILFERDRTTSDPIAFAAIDRGLLPGREVSSTHPLPASCGPEMAEYDNEYRLRAACVQILETSTERGHTLLPVEELVRAADDLDVVHPVPLDAETIEICRSSFDPVVKVVGKAKSSSVQLDRYVTIGKMLSTAVQARLSNKPNTIEVDWRRLVDDAFGSAEGDADEDEARLEKALALERIANNRLSVLIGPAGTGKTTVIKFLLSRKDIVGARVLLLAPTGKARVRLGKETQHLGTVQTVAQFLLNSRYDADTGRYFINSEAPKATATTCIVDESSMLTEDMLAAVVDALPIDCRLILVGDPYQLPPIGAGCPFVDVIEYLRRSRLDDAVAELRTPRRTKRDGTNAAVLSRSDVQLAAIFSGRQLPPGEDEIVSVALKGEDDETVRYRRFESMADLPELIESVLAEELKCKREDLPTKLELSIGATQDEKGYLNFKPACSDAAANWQILSVNRNGPGGSLFINRRIKDGLRAKRLNDTLSSRKTPRYKDWWRFPKPCGPEQIVYGDKVICVRNHQRPSYVYAEGTKAGRELLANGEIGLVTGQRTWGKTDPPFIHVEFESRSDRNFSFSGRRDFSEDGQPKLELAYAITVHKAQGSEFGTVILVLPSRSRLVSREMLYTALTRQSRRIWILHQGAFENFLALRHHAFSDIGGRFTNLLSTFDFRPTPPSTSVPVGLKAAQRRFLTDKLIHRTLRGEMVSSKNEVVIANILYGLEKEGILQFEVEPMLPFSDGLGRWADFRIESKGQTWYWEHCGLLGDENYRNRWRRKLKLYAANGFTEYSEGNPQGRLIVTLDGPQEGLDSVAIDSLARRIFAK